MEEFLAYPEPVENAVIRFNTDAIFTNIGNNLKVAKTYIDNIGKY